MNLSDARSSPREESSAAELPARCDEMRRDRAQIGARWGARCGLRSRELRREVTREIGAGFASPFTLGVSGTDCCLQNALMEASGVVIGMESRPERGSKRRPSESQSLKSRSARSAQGLKSAPSSPAGARYARLRGGNVEWRGKWRWGRIAHLGGGGESVEKRWRKGVAPAPVGVGKACWTPRLRV
eukprot:6199933-Pleurochrysis_carterae.AAC.1